MIRWIFCLIFLFPLPGQADNLLPILPDKQSLTIEFQALDPGSKTPEDKDKWSKLCSKMGDLLSVRKNNLGFVKEFFCQDIGLKSDPENVVKLKSNWLLQLIERRRSYEIRVSFISKNEKIAVISTHFQYEGELLNLLQVGSTPRILSRMILDQLPTGWAFDAMDEKREITFIQNKKTEKLPPLLMVYQLYFDPAARLWYPRIYAKISSFGQGNIKGKTRSERYRIDRTYLPLDEKGTYWVQSYEGVGSQQDALMKKLSSENQSLNWISLADKLIFDNLESNYLGARYGQSLLSKDSVLGRVSQISLLFEGRSGWVQGLRWYYDIVPRKIFGDSEIEEEFALRRSSLGWSISFDPPRFLQSFVSEFNVQPKFGLLDVQGRFVVPGVLPIEKLEFKEKNLYDLAAEFGAEKESESVRQRIWFGFNTSRLGLSRSKGTRFSTIKIGYDSYINIINSRQGLHYDLLLFGNYERMRIDKQSSDDKDVTTFESLGFNLFFVGGGLTVAW